MMNVIKSGQGATGAVDLDSRTFMLKLISSGGAATVSLNGQTVALPASMTNYEDFVGSYDVFTVLTGTVNWVAFG